KESSIYRKESRPGGGAARSMRGNHPGFLSFLSDLGAGPVLLGDRAEGGVEAGVESLLQRLRREPRRLLAVVGQVDKARDERTRVRSTQRLLAVEIVEEVADRLLVEVDALPVAFVPEDAAECLRRRVADADLVCHAAKEGLVYELGG